MKKTKIIIPTYTIKKAKTQAPALRRISRELINPNGSKLEIFLHILNALHLLI